MEHRRDILLPSVTPLTKDPCLLQQRRALRDQGIWPVTQADFACADDSTLWTLNPCKFQVAALSAHRVRASGTSSKSSEGEDKMFEDKIAERKFIPNGEVA